MDRTAEIASRFLRLGVGAPSAAEAHRLNAYLDLLLRWNARMNLTSVREAGEIIDRHFTECVFAARHLPEGLGSLLDFGSGAGLPGVPIAIFRPEIRVVLAESQAKKAAFLREALRTLEIAGEVYGGRVEAMPVQRVFDAVTLRAVDKMEDAMKAARPRAVRYLLLLAGREGAALQDLAPDFLWAEMRDLPGENGLFLCGERPQALC